MKIKGSFPMLTIGLGLLLAFGLGISGSQAAPPGPIMNPDHGHSYALPTKANQNYVGVARNPIGFLGQIGGTTYAVAAQGNRAFVGVGPRLAVVDLADPAHPSLLGQTGVFQGIVRGVAVAGNYAYAVDGNPGLHIVDVSNPSAPAEVAFYDVPGSSLGVAAAGSLVYVASHWEGLRILDVSNPASPVEVGFYDTPGNAIGVTVVGNTAYVADDVEGLHIINTSDPAAPTEVGSSDTPCSASGVAVDGNYAYVADWCDVRIFNISDPATPTEVGVYDGPDVESGVTVAGTVAFVAGGGEGLRIIDVSDPAAPFEVGFCSSAKYAVGVTFLDNLALVAGMDRGLRIVDVSDPTTPVETGSYAPLGFASGVALTDNTAYVVGQGSGLHIIDLTNPGSPSEIGAYRPPGSSEAVAVVGAYAYLAQADYGLRIVDVSDPTAPAEVGSTYLANWARDVTVAGSYAYVAADEGGLRLVDVSDPAAPVEVGSYDSPGLASGVTVVGNTAYLADGGEGLRIVDVSDPAAPTEIGFCDTPWFAHDVVIRGSYAYVADDGDGMRVINVANPAAPWEAGSIDTPGLAWAVAMMEGADAACDPVHAYVADYWDGLRVVNGSLPWAPTESDFSSMPGEAMAVAATCSKVVVGAGTGGLVIEERPRLENDDFANATVIGGLPFEDTVDISLATVEPGEPQHCYGPGSKTVWYAFTPATSGSYTAYADGYYGFILGVYTGESLASLTEIGCQIYWNGHQLTFHGEAGTTYYIRVDNGWGDGASLAFSLDVAPPPGASFGYWPGDPSIFDTIQFYYSSYDPAGVGFGTMLWDFGDGGTGDGAIPTHQYAQDGEYAVNLIVTTLDGRSASTQQTVPVRTHDVSITRIAAPTAARAGQTRPIVVSIKNTRYPEDVRVELYKSTPVGYQWTSDVVKTIPVRLGGRTTSMTFSYTFTADDARMGKVTFKAIATLLNSRDVWPADNEAISAPTRVTK